MSNEKPEEVTQRSRTKSKIDDENLKKKEGKKK